MALGKSRKKDTATGPGTRSFRRFEARRDSSGFPWHRVSGPLVCAALDCATKNSVALLFGNAQGGRGVVVTALLDGDRIKEYASTVGEFHEILIACIEEFQSESEDFLAAYSLNGEELANED